MKIYTKRGDKGMTGLIGGKRVPKYTNRIESYGTVDELNSWLGLLRDQPVPGSHREILLAIQKNLFVIGALLATEPTTLNKANSDSNEGVNTLGEADIRLLESEIDRMNASLPRMTHFILPGGHPTVSYCHIARTVCRRAERQIVQLHEEAPVEAKILVFVNRLSDYLFVLARSLSATLKADEIKWIPGSNT